MANPKRKEQPQEEDKDDQIDVTGLCCLSLVHLVLALMQQRLSLLIPVSVLDWKLWIACWSLCNMFFCREQYCSVSYSAWLLAQLELPTYKKIMHYDVIGHYQVEIMQLTHTEGLNVLYWSLISFHSDFKRLIFSIVFSFKCRTSEHMPWRGIHPSNNVSEFTRIATPPIASIRI